MNVSNRLSLWSCAMVTWPRSCGGILPRGPAPLARRPQSALDDVAIADDPQSGYMGPAVYLTDVIAEQPGSATGEAEAGPGVELRAVFDQADPPEGYERYEGYMNAMFDEEAMRTSLVIVPAA